VLLSVAVATLLRFFFWPVLGPELPLVFHWPAVILSTWYGGLWPGVLATALSTLVGCYFFLEPRYTFTADNPAHLAGAILFTLEGCGLSFLWEMFQRAVRARRRAEEETFTAINQRELWRVTLASIGDAVIVTDACGRVNFLNPAAQELTGWRSADADGRPLEEVFHILHEQTREVVASPVSQVLREGRVVGLENHTLLVSRDGTERLIEDSAAPIRDERKGLAGSVLVFHDVTGRRRLEEQFRQSQKMEAVGRLAGGVAHDFNNLLTVITGFADVVLGRLPAGDSARELVGEIVNAGQRASGLVRQLLAFSRKSVVAPRVLDLNTVVLEMEKMLRRLIGENIELVTRPQPGLGLIKADHGQLEQVIVNLAVNARDAMPQGGRLTVETQDVELDEAHARAHEGARPGRHVLLAVSDTGHGMTAEVMARLFEPFFTTKGPGKGTGLGLATVYGIVRQGGGHVEVYSGVGLGSTFKLYFPRAEEQSPAPGPDPGPPAAPRGSETVLLAEDDTAVRALARQVLRSSGYSVLEADDGAEALRLAGEHLRPIHLLVSDLVMPGVGGRDLARRLAVLHPETKVLFMSGYTDDAVVRHGVLEAEVAFLPKPFAPSTLAQKVREVLDSPGPK
jgi:PAS domain S-box-containing protein